jgi:hypothetical protein
MGKTVPTRRKCNVIYTAIFEKLTLSPGYSSGGALAMALDASVDGTTTGDTVSIRYGHSYTRHVGRSRGF